jgi:flagellin
MISLQTNVNSLVAQQNLNVNNQFQSNTIEQLTSGYRINSSGDDAAGLAVANQLRDNIAQVTQGVANGNDAVAQLQIMDGGMSNISQILDRLQTLATQSDSSTFTGSRATLNSEFQTDIGEISRQAQAIGLNTGGTFAKDLAVYLGGGQGASAASTLTNGTVNLNLSNSTVDAQSLGLTGVQATTAGYDLGSTSATSVANILANATNVAGEATPSQSDFTFTGPGFGGSNGVTIAVNLNQVTDTNSLVTNINAAIQTAAAGTSPAAKSFAAAGISASVVTNSAGQQQLAFTSNKAAFQVTGNDLMASALMGNITAGTSTGAAASTSEIAGGSTELATAGTNGAANTEADLAFVTMATGDTQSISFSANDASGTNHAVSVTLVGGASTTTLANALTSINTALQQTNDSTLQKITAVSDAAGTGINFISTLPGFTVNVGATMNTGVAAATGFSATSSAAAAGTASAAPLQALTVGTGSTSDISTLAGANAAVSAVSAAVAALGAAQATIGKGENQLNYAINLASSQITNFSAAESQIRDADVAQQAANLTQAQTIQQAAIAAMAQANSAPQAVLALLKS